MVRARPYLERMTTLLLMLALQAAPTVALPRPLDANQMRDIGCVAAAAIAVSDGAAPELAEPGKAFAGLVGSQIAEASGQDDAVVGVAMQQAAADQRRAMVAGDGPGIRAERLAACRERIETVVAAEGPLPLPTGRR